MEKKNEQKEEVFEIILINDEDTTISAKEADTYCGVDFKSCGTEQNDVCVVDYA